MSTHPLWLALNRKIGNLKSLDHLIRPHQHVRWNDETDLYQPTDFGSAKPLTELDKFQFQNWALSLIDARPLKEGKGADRGVDGLLFYYETERKDLLNRIREDAPVMHGEPIHRARRRFQWTWVVGGAASPTKMMIPSPPGFWPTVSMAKSGFQLLMDQMLPA
jgi:hypothetical protein